MNTNELKNAPPAAPAKTIEVELFVCVDADGNYEVAGETDVLADRVNENSSMQADFPRRVVRVVLTLPLPRPVTLRGVVPEEPAADATLTAE